MSRVQATVISAGSELEKILLEKSKNIQDLDKFIEDLKNDEVGVFVASKQQVKRSTIIKSHFEPDLLAFDVSKRFCYVIEVKDGDQFDTKKAAGESANLNKFVDDVAKVLAYRFKIYLCSFNAPDKESIFKGLKQKFPMESLITGKELCDLLAIDFDAVNQTRNIDQEANIDYFVEELLKIPEVYQRILVQTNTKKL